MLHRAQPCKSAPELSLIVPETIPKPVQVVDFDAKFKAHLWCVLQPQHTG
jgi:hypothetical protein